MSTLKLYGETTGYVELKAPTSSAGVQVTIPADSIATESYVDNKFPSSPSAGDTLVYNGSSWVSQTSIIGVGRFVSVSFNVNTSWTKMSMFDTSTVDINRGGLTVESDGIVVPEDGVYSVGWNIQFVSAVQRSSPSTSIGVNDVLGAPYSYPILSFTGYIRNISGHDNSSNNVSGLVELSAGDKINIYGYQDGLAGTVTNSTNGSWNIYRIAG
jgi:hypothetical protein